MMIERPRRKVSDLRRIRGDLCLSCTVRKSNQCITICHVEDISEEGHTKRRIEALQKHGPGLRDTVAISVAQQRDAIRAWDGAAGFLLVAFEEPAFEASVPG